MVIGEIIVILLFVLEIIKKNPQIKITIRVVILVLKIKINPKHAVNQKRNFKNNAATISLPILESKHELGNFLAAD